MMNLCSTKVDSICTIWWMHCIHAKWFPWLVGTNPPTGITANDPSTTVALEGIKHPHFEVEGCPVLPYFWVKCSEKGFLKTNMALFSLDLLGLM